MDNIYEDKVFKNKKIIHPGGLNLTSDIVLKIPIRKGAALELGCGYGESSKFLFDLGFSVRAIDISKKIIGENRRKFKNIDFETYNFNNRLPYKDEIFDLVLSECILSFVDNKIDFFNDVNRILKKSSYFCINDIFLIEDISDTKFFTTETLRSIIEKTNFKLYYFKEYRQYLRDYILESIWNGENLKFQDLNLWEDLKLEHLSYFSAVFVKEVKNG